jgi:4-amino-4-deoxy-L-arabinose transferase-like glycosyltransferase
VGFWLAAAVAFIAMLWAVAPGRTLQDALSAEILQRHLAGGYQLRNPPLYEWLLWGVQQFAGPGPLSSLILRYALIAATGVLFYFAALRTTSDGRIAAAFSFSLVLFFWFGWESHHSVSHSLAIIVLVLALWLAAVTGARRGELCGIRWDDIDLAAGVIRVERSWDPRERSVIGLKTRAGRRRESGCRSRRVRSSCLRPRWSPSPRRRGS